MKTENLFGEVVEVEIKRKVYRSKYQRFKQVNNYRKYFGFNSCKTCEHHVIFDYHDKRYHKCKLLGISNSEATDIRVGHVCNKWEDYNDNT